MWKPGTDLGTGTVVSYSEEPCSKTYMVSIKISPAIHLDAD